MTSLFDELKRRNVFRVGIAYTVAAWVVAQVADLVLENIGAPTWVIQTLLLLLAIGFVVALIIAWAYEVTPEGIKRERDVVRDESIVADTGRRLNIITIGLVVVAVALLFADRFLLAPSGNGANVPANANNMDTRVADNETGQAVSVDPGSSAIDEKSIAVMPFVNMSADEDQEYFADGISEEILNALVKAQGLRVAGRTSSFSFKGKDANTREIANTLNVAHVLEGSVRKQGDQVRITAQLIKADDGFNMWSETYDRSLENIFDVQDDIARHVTSELRILLELDAEERLANTLTTNLKAYDLFLRGRDLVGKRIKDNLPRGIKLLEQAVALDPDFAEAWAKLAEAEAVSASYIGSDAGMANARAQRYAQTAIDLHPTLALPRAVIGLMKLDEGDFLAAKSALDRAYDMEPNNTIVLRWLGNLNQALGYHEQALALNRRAYRLDPVSGIDSFNVAASQFILGNLDEALALFRRTAELRNEIPGESEADVLYMKGDQQGAIAAFMRLYEDDASIAPADEVWSRSEAEVYARGVYGDNDEDKAAAAALEHFFRTDGDDLWYWQLGLMIKAGKFDRAFEILEQRPDFFLNFIVDQAWTPLPGMIEFRQDPRFPMILQQRGVVKGWQELGWPEKCQPLPGTDGSDGQFICT